MAISIYKWHRSSRYQKGCGTCLNADFASWGRRCLAETSKSLRGWDGQPDVTEPFSVFKFGFKLLWIVLTSQLWNKCPKRYTLNCLPWNIARKSPIDRQKITTLEYEMKEYGEVLSSDVKWCPDENEVRVVRCGEWNVPKYRCSDPKRAERQEQVSKSDRLRNFFRIDTYWNQEKPRDDINACRVTAKYFLRQLSFALRCFCVACLRPTWWSSNSRLRSASLQSGVWCEETTKKRSSSDDSTTRRLGSPPRGYGHTIHPKKALQWQQCAEAKRVCWSLKTFAIWKWWKHVETCGNMWKHVETCGNMWKHIQKTTVFWLYLTVWCTTLKVHGVVTDTKL